VNFELRNTIFYPSQDWFRLHPEQPVDFELLVRESSIYNNLLEQYEMDVEVIKEVTSATAPLENI
jgi:hypothetical protein